MTRQVAYSISNALWDSKLTVDGLGRTTRKLLSKLELQH